MVCPISIVGPDGTRILYGGEPPTPDLPPAPPTGLTAVAGDAQVTLTWNPNTEPDLADYRVRWTAPSDHLTGIVPADQTTFTDTGLTNGTAYTYVLRAKDAAGNVSEDSASVTVTPKATATTTRTIIGFNTEDGQAPLSSRLVKFNNRAPCVRRYNSNFLGSDSFPITTAVAPEKRVAYSFKANSSGSFTAAGLAAGNGNDRVTAFCEDIPAGWTVFLTYYHEINDDIRKRGFSIANFRDAYEQFRTAIDAANLQSGVTVKLAPNFMAYRVADTGPTPESAFFHDSWVPPVGVADTMTFDIYGNPGHFTSLLLQPECGASEGGEYGTSFPNVTTRFRDMFAAIERNGFADHWGILELNTPPRNWDGPANPDYQCGTNKRLRYQGGKSVSGHDATHTEVERAEWLVAAIEHCLNPPMTGKVPPEVLLLWEHPAGVNWTQKFFHNNTWNAVKPYVVGSP